MVRRTVSYKVLHIQHGEQILRNISQQKIYCKKKLQNCINSTTLGLDSVSSKPPKRRYTCGPKVCRTFPPPKWIPKLFRKF